MKIDNVAIAVAALLCAVHSPVHAHPGSPFQTIADTILTPTCLAGCHGSGASGGMFVDAPNETSWYGVLVNRTPTNASAASFGKLRVDPGRPWNSFLLDKLTGDLKFGEGDPMPRL